MKKHLLCALAATVMAVYTGAGTGAGTAFAQASNLNPKQYLYDEPIKIGVENFEQRLQDVRNNENREPLGLILCGGSARAFCHIGVLKAMEENGVYPDYIVANSMGAIIGLLYAYGFSPDQILEAITSVNLTSYFEPVLPLHGGIISTRKFTALIEKLTGSPDTDLSECRIPIIILTEDLYSQRQIWNASGPLAQIMTQAFAMPVFMEPPEMQGPDGSTFRLADSGSIDIAGIKVALEFSSNLMVSTAFYDPKVNFNNPVVVLNRNFSIGKERIAIHDIKTYNPVLIQNAVEKISFMKFDAAPYIASVGYQSAMASMENITALPHGTPDLTSTREVMEQKKNDFVFSMAKNDSVYIQKNYFGAKIWPFFAAADYPDYYLMDTDRVSMFAFDHIGNFYARAGISKTIGQKELNTELLLNYKPSYAMEAELMVSAAAGYSEGISFNGLYAAAKTKINPEFIPAWITGLNITGEVSLAKDFSFNELLFTAGTGINTKNSGIEFDSTAFLFATGTSPSHLAYGAGGTLNFSAVAASRFGISNSTAGRYAFVPGSNLKYYARDPYHGDLGDSAASSYCVTNYCVTNSTEIFFQIPNLDLTVAEFLIFPTLKAGAFYDFAYNGSLEQCAGGFLRTKLSLIGLSTYILEFTGGWDITDEHPVIEIKISSRY